MTEGPGMPAHLPPPPPTFAPPPPPQFGSGSTHAIAQLVAAPRMPPPTAETLAIPLGPRRLVGMALDLLTRPDAGLRGASFYIGLMLLVTVGPSVILFGVALATGRFDDLACLASDACPSGGPGTAPWQPPAWFWWLMLSFIPAVLGFLAAGVEARALASAVIGGRAEGRPLRLRESVAVARARFWPVLGAQVLVGILSLGIELLLNAVLGAAIGGVDPSRIDPLSYAVSVTVGVVVGTPFIYAPAGIVLGEADAIEALRRSVRLARARKQLAVVITLFSVLAGLVVQFGVGVGLDTVSRVVSGTGLDSHFPPALVVPLAAAFVFAYGTLMLLTEAIAAAPAVHAFVALTHYTAGLEQGRREPLQVLHPWDPWFTRGLAATSALGLVALMLGLLSMPWS